MENLEQLRALVLEFCKTVSNFPGTDGEVQLKEEYCNYFGETPYIRNYVKSGHCIFSIRFVYDLKGGEADEK